MKRPEGDDEIRRLIEEMRNTVKGDKHQLKELSKKIKSASETEKEQNHNGKKRYSGF